MQMADETTDPTKQVSARPVTWNIWALAAVLPLLFVLLFWQLYGLNPERYCAIVKQQGVPAGKFCFDLLTQGLQIKGMVIYLLVGTIAGFVTIALIAAVRAAVSLAGPLGWGFNMTSGEDKD